MKLTKLITLAIAIGCTAQLNAGTLDFEDAASFGGDNSAIDSSYFLSNGFSISAVAGNSAGTASNVTLAFEQTGSGDADRGFYTVDGHDHDYTGGQLGDYFMKLGTGDSDHQNSTYLQMEIDYQDLTYAASGEIWDVDNEDFLVTAYDADGLVIHTLDSSTSTGSGSGNPWEFSFAVDPDSGQVIDKVVISMSSGDIHGLGFDNFQANATPLPAALPLGIAGIGAFMIRKRRKSSQSVDLQNSEEV